MSSEGLIHELSDIAPHNTHPLPYAESWDGYFFTVDLSYRTETEEVDTSATSRDIYSARRHAISNIKRLLNKD